MRVRRWVAAGLAAAAAGGVSGLAFVVSERVAGQSATAVTAGARSDSLQTALYAVSVQQGMQRAYLVHPTSQDLTWFDQAGQSVDSALDAAGSHATAADRTGLGQAHRLEVRYSRLMHASAEPQSTARPSTPADLSQAAATQSLRLQKLLTRLSQTASRTAVTARATAQTLSKLVPPMILAAASLAIGAVVLLVMMLARALVTIRRSRQETRQRATVDDLTGLPNRTLALDRAGQALLSSRRSSEHCAMLLIDIDRFKDINDALGHDHGDLLLTQIGPRLKEALRESDTVARLGGDEFCVVLPAVASIAAANQVAQKLHDAFEEPFEVNGTSLGIEASIGVVVAPDHGDDAQSLFQRAEVAMYVAKDHRLGISCYEHGQEGHSAERATLLGDLRKALGDSQLVLHFQPKVDLATGQLCGFEALVRWNHPDQGLLMPNRFLPLAERTGLIHPLTRQVLNAALAQVRSWRDHGVELPVAVNLSARILMDRTFCAELADVLSFWDVPARLLELEITESALMVDPERAQHLLTQLGQLGVKVAIDDFGTGYSSLTCLRSLPVHQLKIDQQFVSAMLSESNDAFIVRSVIDLGHNLGLQVVAEGVENHATRQALFEMGCDIGQGQLFGSAVPADVVRTDAVVSPQPVPVRALGHELVPAR